MFPEGYFRIELVLTEWILFVLPAAFTFNLKCFNKSLDYNLWHLEFYGRQSPYLPGPPPFPLTPATDSVVESGIAVAAKYVAFQGAAAEQKLIGLFLIKIFFLVF